MHWSWMGWEEKERCHFVGSDFHHNSHFHHSQLQLTAEVTPSNPTTLHLQCTAYSVQCTAYSVQHTVYRIQSRADCVITDGCFPNPWPGVTFVPFASRCPSSSADTENVTFFKQSNYYNISFFGLLYR